jgi:hypothetical protein
VPVEDANKELDISVSVKISNHETKIVGLHRYRVKNIPETTIMLGAIEESGLCSIAQIRSIRFVYVALKDFVLASVMFAPLNYSILYKPIQGKRKSCMVMVLLSQKK